VRLGMKRLESKNYDFCDATLHRKLGRRRTALGFTRSDKPKAETGGANCAYEA